MPPVSSDLYDIICKRIDAMKKADKKTYAKPSIEKREKVSTVVAGISSAPAPVATDL